MFCEKKKKKVFCKNERDSAMVSDKKKKKACSFEPRCIKCQIE